MTALLARCSVDGIPVPQGSMRPIVSRTTGRTFVKQNPKLIDWRSRIAEAARSQVADCYVTAEPVLVVARFRLPRPKSAKKSLSGVALAAKKPDVDKLLRGCLDALSGVWFADDALVVEVAVSKVVCELEERPGVEIELWALEMRRDAAPVAPRSMDLFGRESMARAADDRPW